MPSMHTNSLGRSSVPVSSRPGRAGDRASPSAPLVLDASQRLATLLLVPLAVLLTALILLFYVVFQTATVNGPSMRPTLEDRDYILVTRELPTPRRGDVVTLNVRYRGRVQEWVKRVVALEGDRVDVAGDAVLINGRPEQFAHGTLTSGETRPVLHLTVPAGQVFVLGDDRGVSEDSRFVGPFPKSAIRGKVVAVYAPIERIRLIPGP